MRNACPFFIVAAVVACDQYSKYLASQFIALLNEIQVTGYFNLVYVDNRGMSFGLLSSNASYAPLALALGSSAIVVFLVIWLVHSARPMQRGALALIIGGAVSNVIDRLDGGGVTDFLDFHIGSSHWPAFNLADVAIVCGVATLMFDMAFPVAFRAHDTRR